MFLPEEPLLDAEEARLPHGPGAVEGGPGAALLGLVVTACNDSLYDSCDSFVSRDSIALPAGGSERSVDLKNNSELGP